MGQALRVKICGVTSPGDARRAGLLGADAVGLNFFAGSPRCIDGEQAQAILRVLPPFVAAVGVFVNVPLGSLFQLIHPLRRLNAIQWHGKEHELSDCFPYQLISAFPVRDADSLRGITRYLDLCRGLGRLPDALLLDAHVPGQHGGTGRTAPWNLLASFRPEVPVILAGGLTPENVAEAIRLVRPYGVDVASGVESAPGRKDADRMWRFIDNARAAAAGLSGSS